MIRIRRPGESTKGFRALLGIEEIHLAPGETIPVHEHHDVEIITIVLEGSVGHQDAFNNGTIIFPGDIHRATAGRGISHEEFNNSADQPAHYVQIMIRPEGDGLIPGYEQRMFIDEEAAGRWLPLASRDGAGDTVTIHQDATIFIAMPDAGDVLDCAFAAGRRGYLRLLRGAIRLNGERLAAGDAVEIEDERDLPLAADEPSILLLLDLP